MEYCGHSGSSVRVLTKNFVLPERLRTVLRSEVVRLGSPVWTAERD